MRKLIVFLLILLAFSFLSSLSYSQDASQQKSTMDQLSSNIKKELMNLKEESKNLQEKLIEHQVELETSLKIVQQDLMISEEDRQKLQTLSTELSTSLVSMNQKYNDCFLSLKEYEVKLEVATKWLLVLGSLVILSLIYKIVAIVLRVKGIKLPWILDLIG